MINGYKHLVYVRLSVPFILGILVAVFLSFYISILLPLAVIIVSSIGLLFLNQSSLSDRKWHLFTGAVIQLMMLCAGFAITKANITINYPKHFSHYYLENAEWVAEIKEPPTITGDNYKVKAEVITVFQARKAIGTNGDIIIYLPKDSNSTLLKYGDLLGSVALIKPILPPLNPYEFDTKSYWAWQQYYQQATIYPNQWKVLNINKGNTFFKAVYLTQALCLQRLKQHLQGESLAITASLLLGYRDLIDDNLLKSYAAAGVVHVLSVSGMHVAVIVGALLWLFSWLPIPERWLWTKYLITLIVIWLFACITGLSPAELRAAVIGSFLMLSKIIRRDTEPINALAASAMFLLVINPLMIMDTGFQLSYLAVAGILLIYPHISDLVDTSFKPLNWLWQSIVLSLSATICTLPLTLYYFHQQPVYFIVSNLVVIPLSSFIIYGGCLILIASPIVVIANCIAKITYTLVWAMDYCIKHIALWPSSQIKGIAITKEVAIILGLVILLCMLYLQLPNAKLLMLSITIFAIVVIMGIPIQKKRPLQQSMTIYAVNRHNAVDFVEGTKDVIYADDSLVLDQNTFERHISPCRWYMGLNEPVWTCANERKNPFKLGGLWREGNYLQYHDKRIMIASYWKRTVLPKEKLKIDYLIIAHNAKLSLKELLLSVETKLVVFDNSNPERKVNEWIDQCKDLKIAYYNTREKGAYTIDLAINNSMAE